MPDEDTLLQPGLHVRVIRVREETITEEAPLAYETVYQGDAERELDTRAVIQTGQSGREETRIRVRYENGIEVAREAGTAREFSERLIERGVLCKDTHEQVIRLAPPLIVQKEQLDLLVEQLKSALR